MKDAYVYEWEYKRKNNLGSRKLFLDEHVKTNFYLHISILSKSLEYIW